MPKHLSQVVMTATLISVAAMYGFAGGATEGTSGGGAGNMALQAVDGTPYVDNFWPLASDFTAATGKQLQYAESPMLAARVSSGELPPLSERLPNDPGVLRPANEIGQFGGTLRAAGISVQSEPGCMLECSQQFLTHPNLAYTTFTPNVVAGYELSGDARTFTVRLREGQRWSDGEAFDADDWVFWYDAVGTDDRVFSRIRTRTFQWQGKAPTMRKIDQYTVAYTYSDPYPSIVLRWNADRPFYPEHYLSSFHIEFNSNADALAKENGFESWAQAFRERSAERDGTGSRPTVMSANDIGMPALDPWVIADDAPDSELWERNPYYWKVDTAGNQLPYVDNILVTFLSGEQIPVKVMAGEVDFQLGTGLSAADLPVLKRNEASGNYVVGTYENGTSATAGGWAFNYTHKDPGLRAIFRDLRFRQALSVAVNRQDISDTLFFGQSTPVQLTAPPAWTGFEAWMYEEYAQYDPDLANRLLDEMGLKWDANRKWRLRRDNGQPVAFEGSWPAEWSAYFENFMDLIAQYWEAVGIKMTPKFVPEELGFERAMANDIDASFWPGGGSHEYNLRTAYPIKLIPPWHWIHCCTATTAPWGIWFHSNGAEGDRPDDPQILRAFEVVRELQLAEYGSSQYEALANELLTLNAKNLWNVGTVTPPPTVVAIGNSMGNVPRTAQLIGGMRPHSTDAWYLKSIPGN